MKYKGTKIVKLCLLRLFLCSKWEFFERLAAIGIFDLSGFHLVKRSQATLQELPDCGVSSSFVARERLELSTS